MKVTVNRRVKPKEEYPILKISDKGRIVLFVDQGRGPILVDPTELFSTGSFNEDWVEDKFQPFHGSVTLEN